MQASGFDYEFVEAWEQMPRGWKLGDVGGVAVDPDDRVYVFNRGAHPMLVFDRDGNLLDAWGEGIFTSPHGLDLGWDGFLYCTDDGDHTVRKFNLRGELQLEIGTRGVASEMLSGRPFNRCTHTALSPSGDIYVSDGYRNACVHCFAADGEFRFSWGSSGSDRGQFYVPHNLACDAEGSVYVADRENHRVQIFDGDGTWKRQWNDLHRPMALGLGKDASGEPLMVVGEAGPSFNPKFAGLGPRISILGLDGRLRGRFGDGGFGHAPDRFMAPHGLAVDSSGDIYVGEVANVAWPHAFPGEPAPPDLRTLRKLRHLDA